MMKVRKKLCLLLIIQLLLVGCACEPEQLGLSCLEWESYSPKRQNDLLANYSTITKERDDLFKIQDEESFDNVFLVVSIYNGKIMLPPSFINWQNYQPVKFTVVKGQCLDVEMISSVDDSVKTVLGVCYIGNSLYLDPSRYELTKKLGSVTIPFSPLWRTGFTYKGIDSSGYVKLNNVTIRIKQKKVRLAK